MSAANAAGREQAQAWAEGYRQGATVAGLARRHRRSTLFMRMALRAAGVKLRRFKERDVVGVCERCKKDIRRGERAFHRQGKAVMHARHWGDGRPGQGFRFQAHWPEGLAQHLKTRANAGGATPAADPEEESRQTGRGMLIKEMNWRGLL